MKKEIREFKIEYPINWEYGVTVQELSSDLERIKELGATHINIEPYDYYGSLGVLFEAVCERMETDAEFNERVNKDNTIKESIKKKELKQLEELKKKYENT